MAKVLNLGKVVGSNGKDATINGQNAITLDSANGITVTTESDGVVTIDGNGIKTELTTHASNTDIHVTTAEKTSWNNKAELSDIPTSLPANGGNADTLDGKHAAEFAPYHSYAPIYIGDILDITEMGTYSCDVSDCTNLPPEIVNWCYITMHQFRDTGYKHYICMPINNFSETQNTIWISSEANKDSSGKLIWNKSCDGGNADTLDGLHANEIASNPNLLINSWFGSGVVNQRGTSTWDYSPSLGYCVDCWKINSGSLSDSGILVQGTSYLIQELKGDFKNKSLTLSVVQADGKMTHNSFVTGEEKWYYNMTDDDLFIEFGHLPQSISYVSIHPITNDTTIKYAKLEIGSVATPFIPPNPATELLKIQSMNDDGTPKLISNSALPTIMNSQMVSNPNLLINPDFKINQRGQSEYTSGYTVDRWSLDSNKASISVGTDGVRATAAYDVTSNTHVFWQWLEFPLPPGKYTLSVNVKEVTGSWKARIRTVDADGTFVASYYTPTLCTGVNKVLVDLPENEYISAVSVGFNEGTKTGDSVKLEWIKLEPGSNTTPFCPPDPATELLKCQRYFIRLKNAFGWIGSGFTNKTLARCVIPLPTTMRISPTVTLNGKIYANTPTSLKERAIECTTVRSDISYTQNAIGAGFDLPEGSTSIEPCFMQFRDSESYIDISAEL